MGVSKNYPKMDGLFHGKPYEQMNDLEKFPHYFWFNTHIVPTWNIPTMPTFEPLKLSV